MSLSAGDISRPSLAGMMLRCILFAWIAAATLQLCVCLIENLYDEDYFTRHFVRIEAARIARHVRFEGDRVIVDLPDGLAHYWDEHREAYVYRVVDGSGVVLALSNRKLLNQISSAIGQDAGRRPDFWIRKLDQKWFHVAGGRKSIVGGREIWVDLATLGDPAGRRFDTLRDEIVWDVVVPLAPIAFLTVIPSVLALRRSLRPLTLAAEQADDINSKSHQLRLDLEALPREAASFVSAINRLLARIATLVESQERLISRTAHTLRTSLSVVMLELGKLSHPAARRIEIDVRLMSEAVSRLLVLARIEASHGDGNEHEVHLGVVAEEAIHQLAPLAEAQGSAIVLTLNDPRPFSGDAWAILEATTNLIENALKHAPPGSTVEVTCGPGRRLTVEDSGPGFGVQAESLFEPFRRGETSAEGVGLGLAIVRDAVALHQGTITVGRSLLGGAKLSLLFD